MPALKVQWSKHFNYTFFVIANQISYLLNILYNYSTVCSLSTNYFNKAWMTDEEDVIPMYMYNLANEGDTPMRGVKMNKTDMSIKHYICSFYSFADKGNSILLNTNQNTMRQLICILCLLDIKLYQISCWTKKCGVQLFNTEESTLWNSAVKDLNIWVMYCKTGILFHRVIIGNLEGLIHFFIFCKSISMDLLK